MPPPSLNLKQKLAALSLAKSSPSPPHDRTHVHTNNVDVDGHYSGSTVTPNSRRKAFLNSSANWLKRAQEEIGLSIDDAPRIYGDAEKRMVQDVLGKMIFQAGVDFETRPMVVFNASALPDPQVVPYDLLLTRILSYLNLYVEADYTIVFFAAASKHAPSWNWVWKAYRSLSRKYRKNLKQLYIVHSSFFSKMLFSLAGAIISPKFFRKIVYIATLSDLAKRVPLTQIDIPPSVYQENLKFERNITLPTPLRSNIFGVPLEDLMGYHGEKGGIPRVVKDAIQFLRDTGLQEEGLFRRSPSSSLLRAAQEAYDRGNVLSLETFADPHLAAVLLKKYLRDLPEPIFPECTYGIVKRCPVPAGAADDEENDMASVQFVREFLLRELVPCAYILLSHVLHLLHDVSLRSDYNRMDATNLAIVICPNLVKSSNPMYDVMMCSVPMSGQTTSIATLSQTHSHPEALYEGGRTTLGMIVALCIRRYYEIFDETVDRSEAVPSWSALASGIPASANHILGEDEDLDDDMLVMPISMDHNHSTYISNSYSPSMPSTHQTNKKHRNTISIGSSVPVLPTRSVHNDTSSTSSSRRYSATFSSSPAFRSRSGSFATLGKGSIAIGKGTTRKSTGAAVEAVSVLAEGFFAPPSAPPVPKRPAVSTISSDANENMTNNEEDAPRLTVAERRQLLERNIQS
ncbi:hypothetical protein BDN70DRAFT_878065 [Pholiota conissans]|uniref:Rho GTPase-activating protein n=1 Tax=Pholiota conissans TaxID=109636 RepID=A0A9P6CUW8_9AGAR|nr:hypothetical protein BDN70DRAFT_878065 [Pholiota conissans]